MKDLFVKIEPIKAVKFDPSGPHKKTLPDGVIVTNFSAAADNYNYAGFRFAVQTREGLVSCQPGYWIATGADGEHWPIAPDVFARSYRPQGTTDPRLSALEAENAALAAEVERLREAMPKTADGVPIARGMDIWTWTTDGTLLLDASADTEWFIGRGDSGRALTCHATKCYSTREAAEASRAQRGEAEGGRE